MSAARTERLLNLLTLLLNTRRPVSLRELRELPEFGAYRTKDPKSGERAFERDKAALVDMGVPLRWVPPERDDEEEGTGGYVVDRDHYYLPELDLAPQELALLSIAGAAASTIEGFPGRPAVIRALAKLGFDVDGHGAHPPALAHAPLSAGVDRAKVTRHLEVLHDAVARRLRMHVHYHGLSAAATQRHVDPWGLYYKHGGWYLVGYCHLRQDERTFHLGRIVHLEPAKGVGRAPHFQVPDSFQLSEHVRRRPWEFPHEPAFEVVVRLAEKLVPAIDEIFGPRAQLERVGSDVLVRLQVSHRAALMAAVLPYGAAAEIVSPESLRAEMANTYRALAACYARESVAANGETP